VLEIEQIAIRLPAQFADRAILIGRSVADALAARGLQAGESMQVESLGPIRVSAGLSDTATAHAIAGAISAAIGGRK